MNTIGDVESAWDTPITTKPTCQADPSTPVHQQQKLLMCPSSTNSMDFLTPNRSRKRLHDQGKPNEASPQAKRHCSSPTWADAEFQEIVSESELEAFAQDFIEKCPYYYEMLQGIYQGEAPDDVSEFTALGDVTSFHNDSPSKKEVKDGITGAWNSAKAWKVLCDSTNRSPEMEDEKQKMGSLCL